MTLVIIFFSYQTPPSVAHTNKKRMWRHFQWHGGRLFLAIGRRRTAQRVRVSLMCGWVSHPCQLLFICLLLFLFIKRPNFPSTNMITTKNNHSKRTKKPIEASFNCLAFKGILIISLCFFFLKKRFICLVKSKITPHLTW